MASRKCPAPACRRAHAPPPGRQRPPPLAPPAAHARRLPPAPSPPRSCCVQCGRVLEDTAFSADVTFQKDAGGESTVMGQFVNEAGVARGIGRIHGGRVYSYQVRRAGLRHGCVAWGSPARHGQRRGAVAAHSAGCTA